MTEPRTLGMTATFDPSSEHEELRSLLRATAAGDRAAFHNLYLRCSQPLFRILVRMLKVEAVAQEALQAVFVKIWQRSERYDPE